MELTRTAFDDLRDMGAGTRSLWERMTDANRQTARATVRVGRETIGKVAHDASNVAEDLGDGADKVARLETRLAPRRPATELVASIRYCALPAGLALGLASWR